MQFIKFVNRKATPEYMAYADAKRRCEQPSRKQYHLYGGRGIKFLFKDFEEFICVLGKRPEGHSLDRIDNDGHYCADNVRWATQSEQNKNRRSEILNKHKALNWFIETPEKQIIKVLNMSEFCKQNDLCKENLHRTLKTGWSHKGYKVIKKLGKLNILNKQQATNQLGVQL